MFHFSLFLCVVFSTSENNYFVYFCVYKLVKSVCNFCQWKKLMCFPWLANAFYIYMGLAFLFTPNFTKCIFLPNFNFNIITRKRTKWSWKMRSWKRH